MSNKVAQALAEVAYLPTPHNKVSQAIVEVAYRYTAPVQSLIPWEYTPEGYVITSWVSLNMLDVDKYFGKIKVFSEYIDVPKLYADFRIDNATAWTEIGEITGMPSDELSLYTTDFQTGKRIQFRFRFTTTDSTKTVDLTAWLLESIPSIPQKLSFTIQVRIEDDQMNLVGSRNNTSAEDAYAELQALVSRTAPVTLNSHVDLYSSRTVKLTAISARPLVDADENEVLIATITFIDV